MPFMFCCFIGNWAPPGKLSGGVLKVVRGVCPTEVVRGFQGDSFWVLRHRIYMYIYVIYMNTYICSHCFLFFFGSWLGFWNYHSQACQTQSYQKNVTPIPCFRRQSDWAAPSDLMLVVATTDGHVFGAFAPRLVSVYSPQASLRRRAFAQTAILLLFLPEPNQPIRMGELTSFHFRVYTSFFLWRPLGYIFFWNIYI